VCLRISADDPPQTVPGGLRRLVGAQKFLDGAGEIVNLERLPRTNDHGLAGADEGGGWGVVLAGAAVAGAAPLADIRTGCLGGGAGCAGISTLFDAPQPATKPSRHPPIKPTMIVRIEKYL
jgi:hypothetical protein